jgi:hypothetical protein
MIQWKPRVRLASTVEVAGLPKVSEFFGIAIYIYYREHPPPHFHARYGGQEAIVSIEDLSLLEGKLSPRAMGLVIEWASQRQTELLEAWTRAQEHEAPGWIEPLR